MVNRYHAAFGTQRQEVQFLSPRHFDFTQCYSMTKNEIIRFLIIRSIGNFLVLFAIYGVFATFGPALYYEAQYRIIQVRGIRFTVQDPSQTNQRPVPANILTGPQEQVLIPFDPSFSIVIPKIGASSFVTPNIDSSNQDEFLPILQTGVAHAKGTVFPGMNGNIYLFAHSADNFWDAGRYNAIFYLLKDMHVGDDIVIFFEGKRFNYKITEGRIVDAEDVSFLVGSQDKNAKQKLILQTCWPPGTTWKRLIVFAEPQ